MKKIILLLFIFFNTKQYSQTYSPYATITSINHNQIIHEGNITSFIDIVNENIVIFGTYEVGEWNSLDLKVNTYNKGSVLSPGSNGNWSKTVPLSNLKDGNNSIYLTGGHISGSNSINTTYINIK